MSWVIAKRTRSWTNDLTTWSLYLGYRVTGMATLGAAWRGDATKAIRFADRESAALVLEILKDPMHGITLMRTDIGVYVVEELKE